jgi:hypothetical protein
MSWTKQLGRQQWKNLTEHELELSVMDFLIISLYKCMREIVIILSPNLTQSHGNLNGVYDN